MRLSTDVDAHLSGTSSWQGAGRHAQECFREAMRDRECGPRECITAWEWFLAGWVAWSARCGQALAQEGRGIL